MTSDLKERLDREASVVHARPDAREQVLRRAERRTKRRRVAAATFGMVVSVGLVAGLLATQFAAAAGPGAASPSGAAASRVARGRGEEDGRRERDPTPTSAEWVLSDANTIAPAVGLASGDPTAPRYLIVLTGHFTTNSTRPVWRCPADRLDPGRRLRARYASADRLRHHGPAGARRRAPAILDLRIAAGCARTTTQLGGACRCPRTGMYAPPFDVSSTGVHVRRRHDLQRGAPRTGHGDRFHAASGRDAVPL